MIQKQIESKLGFDKVRSMIANRCLTEYAAERVENEKFSTSSKEIETRLALTDEMRLILMFEDSFPTNGYIDAIPFLTALQKEGSCIDTHQLGKLKTTIDTIKQVLHFFRITKDGVYPRLKRKASAVMSFPDIQKRIERILDKYGDIKDTASDSLYEIRNSIRTKESSLSKRANAILRKAQEDGYVDSDASVNIREGKYLIPVNSSSKRKLSGFVFGESSTGKTSYIEPSELIDIENELVSLHYEETREIQRILYEFSEFLRPYLPELIDAAVFLGELDFLMAKAQIALEFVAGMPVISRDGGLDLRKARHPLLEKALKAEGRNIVPLTITLGTDKRILLISGPNAGGKSVCLKTTGLLQYMFQWGMLIPTSEVSELPIFERIVVSIGDNQNIENDLSTYSSFLVDMREMLAKANEKTLVLIDEFGSGTEPAAGGAIAEAILAEIDKRGVYGVITTHYTNLKLYASQGTHITNGAMLYDSSKIEPMFKLEIGLPGNSFAFELARKMKLPEPIVKDAENRAGDEFVGIERNLRKIVRNRRALDEKLEKVKNSDKQLTGLTEKYQKELEDIKVYREKILAEARAEAEEIVTGARKQVEKTIRDIKEAQAGKEQTKAAREELRGFLGALEQRGQDREAYLENKINQLQKRKKTKSPAPNNAAAVTPLTSGPLKVGEKVRVKDSGMVGEVSKISSKSVTLIIGNISSTMSPSKVERISSNEFREISRKTFEPKRQVYDNAITERKLSFSPELDIRGERLSGALNIVTGFVDDAIMLNISSVRIIHGKGTGVLREEIQKYLRTVPGISVADEDIRGGGTGVTIVTIG